MVKERYEQTEVGVIPEDWDIRAVGDICDFIVPGRNKPRIFKGDIPWITTPDLENGRGVSESKLGLFVSRDEAKSVGSKIVPTGAVLMSCVGELGIVAFVEREIVINQQLHAFIPTSVIDPLFLLNVLQSQKNFMLSIATLTAVPYLNKDNCNSIPIPLPSLPEQRSISQSLSDVDALIDALDKAIAKKRAIKTATMQQLLTGEKRLPGFLGNWTDTQIGTEIDLLTGYPFPSANYSDSGIKLLRGSNIKRGETDWAEDLIQYWSEITPDISQYVLKDGDIVVAMDGSLVGRSFARLSKADLPALLLQRVARIRSEKIDVGYLKEWICSKFFTEHCDAVKTVTAIPHISSGDIRSFRIRIPPTHEEQRAIATVLSDMDTEIAALETRIAKTQALKQGMMQALLTGRIRLA